VPRHRRPADAARCNDRDIQRVPFVRFTWRRHTIGGYWSNPGSNEQVLVGSAGALLDAEPDRGSVMRPDRRRALAGAGSAHHREHAA